MVLFGCYCQCSLASLWLLVKYSGWTSNSSKQTHQIFSSSLLENPGTLHMVMEGGPVERSSTALIAEVWIRTSFQQLLDAVSIALPMLDSCCRWSFQTSHLAAMHRAVCPSSSTRLKSVPASSNLLTHKSCCRPGLEGIVALRELHSYFLVAKGRVPKNKMEI